MMKILLYSFILCLATLQCGDTQDTELKNYANSVRYNVNSGIIVFVTIKFKTEGKEAYTAFLRNIDVWSDLYSELEFEDHFGDVIYDILLSQELEVSQSDYEKMKVYKVESSHLNPKTVVKEYFDSTGVALSEDYEKSALYSALSVLASDHIIIFEEIEGLEINMKYAKNKYF